MSKKTKTLTIGLGLIIIIGLISLFWRSQQASAPVNQATTTPGQNTTAADRPAEPTATFDKATYSTSDPASPWIVVNKTRPLNPIDYAPTDLVSVGGSQRMRAEAATALQKLIAGAKAEGLTVSALSAYRSYDYQKTVYGNEVTNYGQAVADTESARPGYSEHQTGWAVDVGGGGCGIEDCFGDTAEGKWVAANAYKYGFIVRYVPSKVDVTGYRAEPWHIRYIGTELSQELLKQNVLTLEEFFGLPAAPNYTN